MEFQSGCSEDEECFGPLLPPCVGPVASTIIGPRLPKDLEEKYKRTVEEDEEIEEFVKQIKAELPPEENNSEEEVYGPMPCENMEVSKHQLLLEEIEKRASKTKDFLLKRGQTDEVPLKRDAWMTELPPQLTTNYEVTNRRFKMNSTAKDSDRSVWTDTPADRERKLKSGKIVKEETDCPEDAIVKMRDEKQRKAAEEYDRKHKRTESLLEMHAKKLKKKKREHSSSSSSSDSDAGRGKHKKKHIKKKRKKDKKKSKKESTSPLPGRRPFDRDVDLGVSRIMDGSQRRTLIQKSHELNSKFSHGKSHYL